MLLAIVLFAATLGATAAGEADDARDHRVGLPAAELARRGIDAIDDYGAFSTARLRATDVAALLAEGVEVSPLEHALGRGGPAADDVPRELRAPAGAPLQVVQFRGPVKQEWREALERHALRVHDYLPDHAYLVRVDAAGLAALRAMDVVRAVEPYHPAWKLSPSLHAEGAQRVSALAFPDTPLPLVLAQVAATGARPLDATTAQLEHVLDVLATPEQVRSIARLDAVAWIEPAYDEGSLDNAAASALTQGGTPSAWPLHARGVDGSTQMASVCDTGVDTVRAGLGAPIAGLVKMTHEMHDDVASPFVQHNAHLMTVKLPLAHRKVELYYSPMENAKLWGDADDTHGHGTHTAGTLAGDAPLYGERNGHDGVAVAAKLLVCDIHDANGFHVLNDYRNYWKPAYDRGARVSSNSWGSGHTWAYTEKARQHDAYVWEQRDFVIVRSMGNVASTIRTEAVAKSAIAVGATYNGANADAIAGFSGSGPTQDGRVKPNVVAPGACLWSSVPPMPTGYQCLSGTSMSTPAVAGAATLLRDYFAKGYYPDGEPGGAPRNVSAALVRAILQVSGREIGGDRGAAGFPNAVQGWGRVTLDDALPFAGDARRLVVVTDEEHAATTGSVHETTLAVEAGEPLRVMLAWSDFPGAAGADPALVNDLDLRVIDPAGRVLGAPDARNVEEAVYVDAPVAGAYTLRVVGVNVPAGPQPYALVATGALG